MVSLVIMPVGYVVVGPLAASFGDATTLVAAAIVAALPCALVVLVPGIRGVHRTAGGEVIGPVIPLAVFGPAGCSTWTRRPSRSARCAR